MVILVVSKEVINVSIITSVYPTRRHDMKGRKCTDIVRSLQLGVEKRDKKKIYIEGERINERGTLRQTLVIISNTKRTSGGSN